jgi:alanine dehydrogenase
VEFFDADRVARLLPWPELIDAIAEILHSPGAVSPQRHVHPVGFDGNDADVLLLMPAWIPGDSIGVKTVTFFAGNSDRGLSNINASYLLLDGKTGVPLAVMDGEELGSRRTMAASALAARSLARPDAARLLVVGTGQLSKYAVAAHCAVRAIDQVEIWGRSPAKAASVAAAVQALGYDASVSADLDASVAEADVVSCVTSSTTPLVTGSMLKRGAHLDLVGSFKIDMRESDDDCVRRSTIFVDTRDGAMLSGDLAQPAAAGLITAGDVRADLRDLATGAHPGRTSDAEITLFKSAGFALEDLAAARLAYRGYGGPGDT